MPEDPLATMRKLDPVLMKHLHDTNNLIYTDGALPKKIKLLMAMAFDAAHGAEGGVRWLAGEAMKVGATKEEVAETIRVAYQLTGIGSVYAASAALKDCSADRTAAAPASAMIEGSRLGSAAGSPFPGRSLTLFLCARVASILAYSMIAVAVGWQIYTLTGSAFFLGLVGLAQFLPQFLLTLVVGYAADRFDRKTLARLCQGLEAVGALVLALGTRGGWIGSHGILAVVFLIGAARAFEGPAMQALMPRLVETPQFPRAAALSAASIEGAFIVGPALGGFLYAAGPTTVYLLAGTLSLAAAAFLSAVGGIRALPAREPIRISAIFDGLGFIRRRPVIFGAISLDMFAVLLGGATALLPIYAKTILNVGPGGLGLLRGAPSLGAVAMSLLLARRPLRRRVGRTMFAAVIVFGLGTIGFAVSRSFALSLAMLVLLGSADVISVVIRASLVQMGTPDAMRGRVSAVNSLFIGTSNQLGQFESGLTAAWLGTVPAVWLGGLGTIVVALLWMRLFPPLRNADTLDAAGPDA